MYYVIQVSPGMEAKTENQIREIVSPQCYSACFHPRRHMRKKFHGKWKDVYEKLIPGYLFLVSDDVKGLGLELRKVPALTKLLGQSEEGEGNFVSLSERDVEWLEQIMGSGKAAEHGDGSCEVELSQVAVLENSQVVIVSGPLKDMKGIVKKINLHKRIAEVEIDFMNRKTVVFLGIELVEEMKNFPGGKEN